MRYYELVLIVDPDLTPEKQKNLTVEIKEIIERLKGRVKTVKEWEKKEFAYPIKKKTKGDYWLWEVSLSEQTVNEVVRKLKLKNELWRYLLVRKEVSRKVRGKGGKDGAKVAQ